MDLLPKLHNARTVRIVDPLTVEAELELGFGVKLSRHIRLEGLDRQIIPSYLKNQAIHALVVLIGGKKIMVQAATDAIDTVVRGRIYLDHKFYGNPPGMSCPAGADTEMLEVSEYLRSLVDKQFEIGEVLFTLNGKRPKES